jgi:predicted ester cyclase
MTGTDIKTTARQFLDICVNGDDLARLGEFVATDVEIHPATVFGPPDTRGLTELTGALRCIRGVFPDLHVTVEDVLGDADRVALRWTARGTHESEWLGIPPTGRRVVFGGMDLYRFEQGRICEWWRNEDFAYLTEQLTGDSHPDV